MAYRNQIELEEARELLESHPMNGGDRKYNYAQNSSYQKGVINAAKTMIVEAITQNLQIPSNPIFRVADLGCSIGPNTFTAMQNIIEAIELKHQSNPLEFHVFFNDHTDNDFNTLFRTLPLSRRYFAAGVPGSFYNRLFPAATLNFVLSSYAVQWMSKVPNGVGDKNSTAFNKGKTYCSRTRKDVAEVYFDQFKRDMSDFLNARAEEVVEGGLMVIITPCVPDGALPSQTGAAMLQEVLGSCLIDMANMGLINEERVDMFNVPLYFPSPQEMELLIDMNTHFSIERMETLNQAMKTTFDPKKSTLHFRAVLEGLIEHHFGTEIIEQLFQLFTNKLEDNRLLFEKELRTDVDLFILLKRKNEK